MLINGCKTFVVRCQFCGELMEYSFNIFEFIVNNRVEYRCKCGETNIIVDRKKDKDINIEIGCFGCRDKHYYNLKFHEMLRDDNIIYCTYGSELCFSGSNKIRGRIMSNNQVDLLGNNEEMDGKGYFNNFNILVIALKKIYILNEENKIYCNCGNSKIDIELFPDRIEIKCYNCHSVIIIFTETEEDLSVLLKRDKIILREHNISCIDSINEEIRNIKE